MRAHPLFPHFFRLGIDRVCKVCLSVLGSKPLSPGAGLNGLYSACQAWQQPSPRRLPTHPQPPPGGRIVPAARMAGSSFADVSKAVLGSGLVHPISPF